VYIPLCDSLLLSRIVTLEKGTLASYRTIVKSLCKEGFKAFAISTFKRAENGKI